MNLTAIEKIKTLLEYTFSSFLSIELLMFCILLFVLLIANVERKARFVTYCAIGIYIGLLIGTMIVYNDYILLCIKEFFKMIIKYICFPTTVAFFTTIVFITIIMIYTLFSKKLTKFKKIVNYLVFSIIYYLFMSFVALTTYYDLAIEKSVVLYSNDYILAIVQICNCLFLIWIIFTLFYRLYLYFKRKYD